MMNTLVHTLLLVPLFLLAISVHEYAHAWTAVRRGDPTPLHLGRLTLDFRVHLSLVGTIMLIIFGIGWAKPVSVNPRNLRNPRADMFWIALAGPISNLVLAVFFALLFHAFQPIIPFNTVGNLVARLLFLGVHLNIILFFFNLLPIPPLDGSKLIARFIPPRWNHTLVILEQYGILILFLLLQFSGLGSGLSWLTWSTLRLFGFHV